LKELDALCYCAHFGEKVGWLITSWHKYWSTHWVHQKKKIKYEKEKKQKAKSNQEKNQQHKQKIKRTRNRIKSKPKQKQIKKPIYNKQSINTKLLTWSTNFSLRLAGCFSLASASFVGSYPLPHALDCSDHATLKSVSMHWKTDLPTPRWTLFLARRQETTTSNSLP